MIKSLWKKFWGWFLPAQEVSLLNELKAPSQGLPILSLTAGEETIVFIDEKKEPNLFHISLEIIDSITVRGEVAGLFPDIPLYKIAAHFRGKSLRVETTDQNSNRFTILEAEKIDPEKITWAIAADDLVSEYKMQFTAILVIQE